MAEKITISYNKSKEADAVIIMDCGRETVSNMVKSLCQMAQVGHINVSCKTSDLTIADYNRMIEFLQAERDELIKQRENEEDKRQLKLFDK
jgi:Tfp pilus assembly pilus retraction ATPase PilT